MTLFKQQPDGAFEVLERMPFDALERDLEDWIEANPRILLEGEMLAVIARQPRNTHGKFLDLLAVDERGAAVVVELKRGEAPREILAQAFEYAAWVDSLSFDQLDEIARRYAAERGLDAAGLHDLYRRAFGEESADGFPVDPSLITFNSRQRIVLVAESFTSEVEETARYFRSRMGADLYAVQFQVHRAGAETVLETTTVVGREPTRTPAAPRNESGDDDAVRAYVKSDFVRTSVGAFERWVEAQADASLTVERPGWNRRLRYRRTELLYWFYAQRWISIYLKRPAPAEFEHIRSRISRPESVSEYRGDLFCHLAEPADIALIEGILAERVARLRDAG